MPKIILLTGAPTPSSLNWDVPLHTTFIPPISTFLDLDTNTNGNASTATTDAPTGTITYFPQWRSIPLKRQALHTGLTQDLPTPFLQPTDFEPTTTTSDNASEEDPDDLRSQFYDHSLALDTTIFDDPDTTTTSSSSIIINHHDTTASFDSHSQPYSPAPSLDPPGPHLPLTTLSTIPRPQTQNPISLIAAILTLTPRLAHTRFGPRPLLEAIVGDETRSGFQITFWRPLPIELRRGDVVLVQGVRLGVFRGRVYGQSMGDATRVFLLYRRKSLDDEGMRDDDDHHHRGGHYRLHDLAVQGEVHPQLERTRRVRRWVLEFLGNRAGWDEPPDDTQ